MTALVDVAPKGDRWLHEIKFDGYPIHACRNRCEVRLLTCTGLGGTHKYPQSSGQGQSGGRPIPTVIGDARRSRSDQTGATEIATAAAALNRMLGFGRPNDVRIARMTEFQDPKPGPVVSMQSGRARD